MITLLDEIVAALPGLMQAFPDGPTVQGVASHLCADAPSVRRALFALDADGRALLVRANRGGPYRLVPIGSAVQACRMCHVAFERPKKSKRVTCSRACAVALSWRDEGTAERRSASIRAERATPQARERASANNRKRWSRPGEREKLADQSRRRWADPVTRAELSCAISAVNGSPVMRAKYSAIRKALWQDEAYRKKTTAGIHRSTSTPEARAKFSKLLKARWADPVWRKKYMAAVGRNAKKGGAARAAKRAGAAP